jgi:hypothetical protein
MGGSSRACPACGQPMDGAVCLKCGFPLSGPLPSGPGRNDDPAKDQPKPDDRTGPDGVDPWGDPPKPPPANRDLSPRRPSAPVPARKPGVVEGQVLKIDRLEEPLVRGRSAFRQDAQNANLIRLGTLAAFWVVVAIAGYLLLTVFSGVLGAILGILLPPILTVLLLLFLFGALASMGGGRNANPLSVVESLISFRALWSVPMLLFRSLAGLGEHLADINAEAYLLQNRNAPRTCTTHWLTLASLDGSPSFTAGLRGVWRGSMVQPGDLVRLTGKLEEGALRVTEGEILMMDGNGRLISRTPPARFWASPPAELNKR